MSTQDPPRLSDPASGSSSVLREALAAGRDDLPAPDQLQNLAAALGPILSGPSGGGGAAGPAAAGGGAAAASAVGSGAMMSAKLAGVLLAGVVAVGGGAAWLTFGTDVGHEPRPAPHARPPQGPPRTTAPAPPAAPPAPAAPEPQAAPEPTRPSPPLPPPDPREEVRMLQEAQDALGGSPARALALAGEHARRFPRGMLAQEREVLAIDALTRLGRHDAARQRAERFHARWPGSSHSRRVDALVGGPTP